MCGSEKERVGVFECFGIWERTEKESMSMCMCEIERRERIPRMNEI